MFVCSIRQIVCSISMFFCSIWHLAVPFDRAFNVWLFHLMFSCSIWCLAVPFDDWLIQLQSSGGTVPHYHGYFVLSGVWLFHCKFYSCFTLWLVVLFQPQPFHLVCNCFICNYASLFNSKLTSNLCLTIPFQPRIYSVLVNCSRFVYFMLYVLLVYLYSTSTIRHYAEALEVCLIRFTYVA